MGRLGQFPRLLGSETGQVDQERYREPECLALRANPHLRGYRRSVTSAFSFAATTRNALWKQGA